MFRAPRFTRRRGGRAGSVVLVAATLALILVPGVRPVAADQLSDAQNQRNAISKQMDQLKAAIQNAKDAESQVKAIIASLDLQISTTEHNISDAQAKLDQIGRDLDAAQAKLVDTRAKLARDKKQLAQQLVYIYKQGQASTLNQVIGANTFNDFWQKLIDLRRLASSQQTTLRMVQDEEKQVVDLVAQVAAQKKQQQGLLADLRNQADNLQLQLGARQAAVAQLELVQARDAQLLAQAEQSRRDVDAEIAKIKAEMEAAARRGGGNGHFVWPESGPITQGFGCTPYPFEPWSASCASHHFHSGLDLGASWGTPVGAGDSGIAYTYVSSYGYGNHVIIVHGNGWLSLYGHLASFAVGNGQGVGRGQTIGYEGSTGNSTGPHLHFEIRLNDVPQNPLQYLP
ncbi:MAG TPA: peptidoglycan DD-metalloendopeptidase family protein [Candidatus Dormibacteraeota bacterium]|nr:peptidoglycan DD-metalloendopeptidase family protein [Candidatus Dormibacteraeota bacterium]